MISMQSRIDRKYTSPKDSIYAHRFFEDLTSGYSFTLSKKGDDRDFFSFEPQGCMINNLMKGQHRYYSSYEIEQIISRIAYDLMAYGRAYVYIKPEYTKKKRDDGTEAQELSSIEIEEIRGIIKKKTKTEYIFCVKSFNGEAKDIQIAKNQFVILTLRELGFSKRFFTSILTKLSTCDITGKSTDMITNHSDVYDFTYHVKSKKLAELKILSKIGWTFGNDALSDSYIMYKKIQEDQLRLRFLEYIIRGINEGLHSLLGESSGELVAHINKKDYKQLWNDYSSGKITGAELSKILYGY